MIAPSVVEEVRRLLGEGNLSQRKIARLMGISRGTVGAIASGKRPDYESPRRTASDGLPQPSGPPERCPGCGGMVYMPCRLCGARALRARSSRPPLPAWLSRTEEPLGLDLKDADRARYEQVRLRRANAEAIGAGPEAGLPGTGTGTAQDGLEGAMEVEDDQRVLEPADLWDAFDWEDEEPAIDYAGASELVGRCPDEDDERLPADCT